MIQEVRADSMLSMDLGGLGIDAENLIVSRLDDAQNILVDEVLAQDPIMLSTYYDLTTTGAERYYIPDSATGFDQERIIMIEDIGAGSDSPVQTVYTLWGDRLSYHTDKIITTSIAWSVRDNYLELPNLETGSVLRVWYTRRPTGFFYCTAASGTTTTAALPATMTAGELILEDDIYIGMKVAINTQVRSITDWVASTRTLTFAAVSSAVGSSTIIDLISPLPKQYQHRIVDLTCRRMRIGLNDDDLSIARYDLKNKETMQGRLSRKSRQEPELISKVDF